MPNRILFLVSAMLASLALPVLPTVAHAADDCLTSPTTAAGGHWKYHLERGTGRKCWYLVGATPTDDAASADTAKQDADADGRNIDTTANAPPKPAAKVAPSLEAAASSPPERPRTPQTSSSPAASGPANNARAEFIDTSSDARPASSTPAQPDAPQAAAPAGNVQQGLAQQGSLATRWPSPGTDAAADGATAAADPAPSAQPVVTEPPPAPATQTAPTAQPPDQAEGPDYLLYALIIFTCAFAAVVAFAGLRFVLEWWRDWREETQWRQSEQTYAGYRERSMTSIDEVPMELVPSDDAPMPWASTQRPLAPEPPPPRIEDEIDRIERLLALTRQTTPEAPSMWDTHAHAPRDAAE